MSNALSAAPKRGKRREPRGDGAEASAQAEVLSRMIGEVKAPLESAGQSCRSLLDGGSGPLSPEQRRRVEGIALDTSSALRRMVEFVDLLLLRSGGITLSPRPAEIGEIINSVVAALAPMAHTKGLVLEIEPPLRPLPQVSVDPARMGQVLAHLLDNAIKFTDKGRITVSTEIYDRSVAVHVVDTGIGISPAAQAQLFSDFFQVDPVAMRESRGGGLGLTLSRLLVIQMGGDIWSSSTLGTGSRFSFTVPRRSDVAVASCTGTA